MTVFGTRVLQQRSVRGRSEAAAQLERRAGRLAGLCAWEPAKVVAARRASVRRPHTNTHKHTHQRVPSCCCLAQGIGRAADRADGEEWLAARQRQSPPAAASSHEIVVVRHARHGTRSGSSRHAAHDVRVGLHRRVPGLARAALAGEVLPLCPLLLLAAALVRALLGDGQVRHRVLDHGLESSNVLLGQHLFRHGGPEDTLDELAHEDGALLAHCAVHHHPAEVVPGLAALDGHLGDPVLHLDGHVSGRGGSACARRRS
mmetsp:Transcript_52/g.145  ORF Transcript_52/g.145 Transcript_52/m.145 type:complete len:259 (-) Transcript_52:514-1290(-)